MKALVTALCALPFAFSAMAAGDDDVVDSLLARMSLEEKIGQMVQVHYAGPEHLDALTEDARSGKLGSLLNVIDAETANALQRAASESPHGIPLLLARDVIHGFRTIFPIPLGQAASWNPDLVETAARVAAVEAASTGINWTFAPMIDLTRDPRWGRIAESPGEDTLLVSRLGVAMIRGFQGDDLADPGSIAACAKHFAGYGASEAGRDYNTTNIAEHELRNVYLPPFHAAVEAGVATMMTSFSDLNGVPASGNRFLLQDILRDEWGFDGMVVSDWASIEQLSVHGLTANDRDAARAAVLAGVNMEMVSTTYRDHLADLVAAGVVPEARVDRMVREILLTKQRLGLFEDAITDPAQFPALGNDKHLQLAHRLALQSLVLLENHDQTLPLDAAKLKSIAVIGPLADAPHEQMGTWVFDGDEEMTRTPLAALREQFGETLEIHYEPSLEYSRSKAGDGIAKAVEAATRADVALLFLGEESILSGEAHSRAQIDLPGRQEELVRAVAATGKPVIAVIMAGRPLTLTGILDAVDGLIYAWHPGTMGGPAIADVLFGKESPSGKLPVTFPRMVGQIPIYYGQKNTGKPATPDTYVAFDDLPQKGHQAAFGMTSHHLDAGYTPQYPFGYGLSYTRFEYSELELGASSFSVDESLEITVTVTNSGAVEAEEVVQLYVRDPVASVTRPVRELKDFTRVRLAPGASLEVAFQLTGEDLMFYGPDMTPLIEPGDFQLWVGGDSTAALSATFTLTPPQDQGEDAP